MALFCLPKALVKKLKASALKGEIDIKKLYSMSSAERRAFFTKFTDKELGKYLNVEFEKAMISKQKGAITDWAKSVFTPQAKLKPAYKNVLDKIAELDSMGVLTPKSEQAFLEDLVADKLGVTVTPEEVAIISEKAQEIQKAQLKLGDNMGDPNHLQENLDFFKAKKSMDDYLLSRAPASQLKVLTGTIGRGMMLASFKSPILNIGSNTELAITEALGRRLASGQFKGADNQLALDFVKMVNKIYKETGYDLSRMIDLSDTGASGSRVLGDTVHSQGEGRIRQVGRIVEDVVFKNLMGAPDAAFGSAHFADSVNLNSLKMAKGDKTKAKVMMLDSMRLKPQTEAGELLRNQGILDAQVATWTNDTWASEVSTGIRKILNNVSGDLRIGDYELPFVKTPANTIATGMDYAGLGAIKALRDTIKAVKNGDLKDPEYIRKTAQNLTRAGIGLVFAAALALQLDDDDYMGAYDPARAQIEQLRNSNTNSFRIGGKWISTNWLGPIAVPFTAIMYARKYGKTGPEKLFQYVMGVGSSIGNLPGIADIYDTVRSRSYKKNQTLDEATTEVANYAAGEAQSRLVPSIFSDVAKATDKYERDTSGGKIVSVIGRIPGVRYALPIKRDIFGEEIKGEPWWSDLVFGSRVKTDKDTPLIKEIRTVSEANDKPISFTNWDKSGSATLGQFKEKVGAEKYDEAKVKYGQELKNLLEKTISSKKYQDANDADKLKTLTNLDSIAMAMVFKQYKFTYKKAKK